MIDNLEYLFLAGLMFIFATTLFLMVRIFSGDRAMITSKNPTGYFADLRAGYWVLFGMSFFFVVAFIVFSFDLYKLIPNFLLIQ